jgi:periplasmic divalent cation tolerance protein
MSDASDPMCILLSTFPNEETARRIASTLVEERHVACVNLLPGATSIYRWEGKVESAKEVMAILKTREASATVAMARIKELHPYEVPEIIQIAVKDAHPAYLAWVNENCAR